MTSNIEKPEIEIGGKKISYDIGTVAKQASGAVLVRMGDTVVLVAVACGKEPRVGTDFFPLTVDYRARTYAAGRIPGGFFKREGKARDSEVLTSRLTDRSIRPLFPEHMRLDVQMSAVAMSYDNMHDTDLLVMNGASMALAVSDIPWAGPIGAVRVGRVDDKFVLNPNLEEQSTSTLDLVVAGKKGAIMMVESGSQELSEDLLLEALALAQREIDRLCDLQLDVVKRIGKAKFEVPAPVIDAELSKRVGELAQGGLKDALRIAEKSAREKAISQLKKDTKTKLAEQFPDKGGDISSVFGQIEYEEARKLILDERKRSDGRGFEDIRPITCQAPFLPLTHGSALFTRGQTQALATVTLGSPADKQIMDELEGEYKERFMMHYNFPGFSTGEAKPERGPGRREIGHGALARRALLAMLPTEDEFPYTLRIVSDILESNGSSSMASVCGGSLALFDAGVPLKKAVAGIAMGLVMEGGKTAVLSDIMGMEDHLGDMDFKVAGTVDGVTALQMDIKVEGISIDIMRQALAQAKKGRLHILGIMNQTLSTHRPDLAPHAPRMSVVQIPIDKIGALIGPGGKNIRGIIEKSGAQVDVEDDGKVYITSNDGESMAKARGMVEGLTAEAEVGKIYKGTVVRIMPRLGAFVQFMPGKDGLVQMAQLDVNPVRSVEDVVKVGDEIDVKCIEIDNMGRVNLSRRAVIKPGSELEVPPREPRRFEGRDDRGGRGGGFRGGRGGGGGRY